MLKQTKENIKSLILARRNFDRQEYLSFWLEQMNENLAGDALVDWFRSFILWLTDQSEVGTSSTNSRFKYLIQTLEKNPQWKDNFSLLLVRLLKGFRGGAHFAEIGLLQKNTLSQEVQERILLKILPHGSLTEDLEEFVRFVFEDQDVSWLLRIENENIEYIKSLLKIETMADLRQDLREALLLLGVQVQALGLQAEFRLRLKSVHMEDSAFYLLGRMLEQYLYHEQRGQRSDVELLATWDLLKQCRLELERIHQVLSAKGVSSRTVFQMSLMKQYLDRIQLILENLSADLNADQAAAGISSQAAPALLYVLISKVQQKQGIRNLISENMGLMARTITDRVASTGEHYMVKTWDEYKQMLWAALGGGFVTSFTVYLKMLLGTLAVSALVGGLFASVNYAISFLVIQWVGFTLGTKQPAMTAAALAKKLKNLGTDSGRQEFLYETQAILRSQSASIFGNLLMVIPAALILDALFFYIGGRHILTIEQAQYTVHSMDLMSAVPIFAAFTGLLLWLSSLFSGWVENWFTLRGIGKRISHNRIFTRAFGERGALEVANTVDHHIGGIAANTSLAFLLGLTPPLLKFIGIPLEVRHITLSTGQMAASLPVLGAEVWQSPSWWWALMGLLLIGILNVMVSFGLALGVALRAQGVSGHTKGVLLRWVLISFLKNPRKFFFP